MFYLSLPWSSQHRKQYFKTVDLHLQCIHAHEHTAIHTLINALVNQFYSIQGHIVILFLWLFFSSWSLRTCILWCSPFWRIMGPRITQMLYYCCILFSFPTYGPIFSNTKFVCNIYLDVERFFVQELGAMRFSFKVVSFFIGWHFSGNTPYFHGLLHSSFHSSFPGHMKSTGIQI